MHLKMSQIFSGFLLTRNLLCTKASFHCTDAFAFKSTECIDCLLLICMTLMESPPGEEIESYLNNVCKHYKDFYCFV